MIIKSIILLLILIKVAVSSGLKLPELGAEISVNQNSVISPENLEAVIKGVQEGVKESIYYMGLLHLYGLSIPKDVLLATEMFLRAADLGHVEAQTAYAVLLLATPDVSREQQEHAEHYLKIAANAHDANAKLFLAKHYIEVHGPHASDNSISAERLTDAMQYLQELAIVHNHAEAHHQLGVLHEYGVGVSQSYEAALQYYQRGVDLRYLESIYHAGLMHAYGRGTPQDFAQSASLFISAASAGHAPSMYYMGITKTYGYGCAVDYEEARRWFDKAAGYDDVRVNGKANQAAKDLRRLLESADTYQENVIKGFNVIGVP